MGASRSTDTLYSEQETPRRVHGHRELSSPLPAPDALHRSSVPLRFKRFFKVSNGSTKHGLCAE